jgi:regulatory protein
MRLRKKGYTPEQIEQTMSRLRQRGYVDDREFARFWIGNRQSFSPRGPHLLRSELRQKGVPAEVVEEALAEYKDDQAQRAEEAAAVTAEYDLPEDEPVPGSDEATALGLARKRMRLLAGLDPQVTRRRLYSFLARRGYGFDTIDMVVRRVMKPGEDEVIADE